MPQTAGPFPEESPTLETKHAFPQSTEVDGHNGNFEIPNNRFDSAPEWKQFSGPADGAFRENANDVATLQFGASPLDGFCRLVRPIPDWDCFRKPEAPG